LVHAEISVYPMGTDTTSASIYIARGIEAIQNFQEVRYQITPMGTILESENIEKIFEASRKIIEAVHMMGVKRVEAILKIDSRTDKKSTLEGKLESVNKYLKSK
jgi:uncharacterized protein (TIGR00106 family)